MDDDNGVFGELIGTLDEPTSCFLFRACSLVRPYLLRGSREDDQKAWCFGGGCGMLSSESSDDDSMVRSITSGWLLMVALRTYLKLGF